MRRALPLLLPILGLLAQPGFAAPATPAARLEPLRITGRLVAPAGAAALPAGLRLELRPLVPAYGETVRGLGGAPEPAPLAATGPRADGSFELTVPEPGFYRLAVRAEGTVPVEHPLLDAVLDLPEAEGAVRGARLLIPLAGCGGHPTRTPSAIWSHARVVG